MKIKITGTSQEVDQNREKILTTIADGQYTVKPVVILKPSRFEAINDMEKMSLNAGQVLLADTIDDIKGVLKKRADSDR